MDDPILVYTTWPSAGAAETAGRRLVEAKLAACVNILPGMTSLYAWQGAIERAEEVVMIVKTRRSMTERVIKAVRDAHPYEVPAILALPTVMVDEGYAAWIREGTGGQAI